MPKELTVLAVVKLKPGRKRYAKRISRHLYVIVQPGGSKSWAARFSRDKLVLGPVDFDATAEPAIGQPLTLHGAKQLAAQVLRERESGRDPVAEHRAARQRRWTEIKEVEANAFGTLVCQYVEEHLKAGSRRKWCYFAKQLGLHYPKDGGEPTETKNGLAQRWRERDVRTIDGAEIFSIVDEARRRGTPGIVARKKGLSEGRARDLHTALSSMFSWMLRNRHISVNPCSGTFHPTKSEPIDRILTNEEIVRFWRACDQAPVPFGSVLKLLLLTGARRDEIGEMPWSELRDDGTWLLPASRAKNRKSLVTPLPPLALEIINSVPRIEGCPFVFTTTGRTPISGWSKVKRGLDAAMGDPPKWRIHDLRATAITGMDELGIDPVVIELVVNHSSGIRGGIAGRYNKGERMDERRKALLRWSQHISGLVSGEPTKVVRLHSR